ncbi:MAG: GAF domain-containing protein, partial [Myxococcales bacterium]
MFDSSMERLLSFARKLQNAASFGELLDAAQAEARDVAGYEHVWFYVGDVENPNELRLIEASSRDRQIVWDHAQVLSVADDPLIQELLNSDVPIVIPDARFDPRTDKRIVDKLQNRTLINIPLRLLDKPFGVFGLGTYGEEGVR